MKRFFSIAAVFASLALLAAPTARGQGIGYAIKLVNDPLEGLVYKVVATNVTGSASFMSINITYPKQLTICADALDVPNASGALFSCTESPGAATLIVRGGSGVNATQLMKALNLIWFKFKPGESVYTMP